MKIFGDKSTLGNVAKEERNAFAVICQGCGVSRIVWNPTIWGSQEFKDWICDHSVKNHDGSMFLARQIVFEILQTPEGSKNHRIQELHRILTVKGELK